MQLLGNGGILWRQEGVGEGGGGGLLFQTQTMAACIVGGASPIKALQTARLEGSSIAFRAL